MKEPIAALFKALIDLNKSAQSDEINLRLLAQQGLVAFGKLNEHS